MAPDMIRLLVNIVSFLPSYTLTLLRQRVSAFFHKRSYKPLPDAQLKNVVVVGGSFAGFLTAKRLTETLPTGYRVVLVERSSHLNYLFAFPRFSVAKGYEKYGFIPYSGIAKNAPQGIFEHVQDTAVDVTEKAVVLKSGAELEYECLLLATGTSSTLPSKVASTERGGALQELRGMQERIGQAKRIAVVGGGAVGVELASDIKDFFPEKEVALIHSRAQLLPTFGKRLHEYVMGRMKELGVAVRLNERPEIPSEGNTLKFRNGEEETFGLIIPCTGQRPNSSILTTLSPSSISNETSHILVKPTLQLQDDRLSHVFAIGDVAATGGPKMARAAQFQGDVVVHNILSLMHDKKSLQSYKPKIVVEGAIKLTLGKARVVIYAMEESGKDMLIASNSGKVDMDVKRQWRFFGADTKAMEVESGKV